ncbi:MAG: hypothetical protein WAO83_17305 [Fuerstiella sp.]
MLHRSPVIRVAVILSLAIASRIAIAHDDHSHHYVSYVAVSQESASKTTLQPDSTSPAANVTQPMEAFRPFSATVKVRSDGRVLFIESNGLPQHNMMVGIKSWQQQVPLPQHYTGNNAWQIPLQPRLAEQPISAKTNLFRGAIAIAVNGVPIFNAFNNRKEDAFLAACPDTRFPLDIIDEMVYQVFC